MKKTTLTLSLIASAIVLTACITVIPAKTRPDLPPTSASTITHPTSGFPPHDRPQVSANGDIIIRIVPCITPTVVADYRDLLSAGTYSYSSDGAYYIKGYDIAGQVTPTPPPPLPGNSLPVLIDPLTARIVYTSTLAQDCGS